MMTVDYDLMKKANPLLFAPERYDQYPLQPQELMQYLTSASAAVAPRPATTTDELDYLLYTNSGKNGNGSNDAAPNLDLDLDKKLACEFALYQTHMHNQEQKKGTEKKGKGQLDFTQLTTLRVGSEEWFEEMLGLMESINATNIDLDALRGGPETRSKTLSMVGDSTGMAMSAATIAVGSNGAKMGGNDAGEATATKDIPSSGADELQEVISYILSSAIKSGVDIRPKAVSDGSQQEFLRTLVDEMLQRANNSSVTAASSASAADDSAQKNNELNTALGDLQLAHTFLTKQYENDRSTHAQDIAKLTRANRELQEKILQYHDDLHNAQEQLRETHTSVGAGVGASASLPELPLISPSEEGSAPGSSSYSLGLMRTEFQRLLAESERNHEAELARERAARQELEKQLGR